MNIPGTIVMVGLFIPYTGFTMAPPDWSQMVQTAWQKVWQMPNSIACLISMQVIISNQKTTEL